MIKMNEKKRRCKKYKNKKKLCREMNLFKLIKYYIKNNKVLFKKHLK